MFEQFEIENGLIIGNRNSMEMKVEGMVSNIFTNEAHCVNIENIKQIMREAFNGFCRLYLQISGNGFFFCCQKERSNKNDGKFKERGDKKNCRN